MTCEGNDVKHNYMMGWMSSNVDSTMI
jgi:hypothetical protein